MTINTDMMKNEAEKKEHPIFILIVRIILAVPVLLLFGLHGFYLHVRYGGKILVGKKDEAEMQEVSKRLVENMDELWENAKRRGGTGDVHYQQPGSTSIL